MRRVMRKLVVVVVILAAAGGAALWYFSRDGGPSVTYRTAPVKRGDLLATISATGTLEPEEVVDVGAQVAGQIDSFGKDKSGKMIDYGSAVEADTVLAQIDDSLYAADVALAQAQLQQAQASVARAEADLLTMKAKLDQAQRDWDRAQKLGPSEALAATSYDAYKSTYETAKANVTVDEAAILQAKGTVAQSQAALLRARRNLEYCTIKSPVKGVIIDRRVNIGQTVVSSLNAPSLFLIAKDLTRMQVWVSVNEADVGSIHSGQHVTFTVDAYPGQVFQGVVGKVRFNATMTQNVVTYTVEVITDNPEGKLLPYLTANVQFELDRRANVLTVPNPALRWTPLPDQIAPQYRSQATDRRGATAARPVAATQAETRPGGQSATRAASQSASDPATQTAVSRAGMVWVRDGNFVRPVKVRVGLSDGAATEVQGKELTEGMEVIVGEQQKGSSAGSGASPFTPQIGRPSR